ncbi:hypothetical protein CDAR_381231 [Caerostris darwini]|uniref:Uncharacterized protein n=1 Tax=Caerostris darwini TaxID=1538125 RepID=A0AAV4PP04_9ARAC|nr:hypothetical protein CDAR_381231 [Caerostris darwini]
MAKNKQYKTKRENRGILTRRRSEVECRVDVSVDCRCFYTDVSSHKFPAPKPLNILGDSETPEEMKKLVGENPQVRQDGLLFLHSFLLVFSESNIL